MGLDSLLYFKNFSLKVHLFKFDVKHLSSTFCFNLIFWARKKFLVFVGFEIFMVFVGVLSLFLMFVMFFNFFGIC